MLDVRVTLAGYLQSKGVQVLAFGDAFEGIETIRSEHPDLVLCDIGLPGGDGFQLLAGFATLDRVGEELYRLSL